MAALRNLSTTFRNIKNLNAILLPTVNRCLLRSSVRTLSNTGSFKYEDLEIELTRNPRPQPHPDKLVFGHEFSDHMFEVQWSEKNGWGKPRISPVHNLSLHPAAKVLHYAVELFEGMKAYRGVDNRIRLFRPMENMSRMSKSAVRSCLPEFDSDELYKCMKKLICVDQEWVPYSNSSSLYIRPTFIGTEPSLGVQVSKEALLYVLTGPVGPYYSTGFKPVSLLANPSYIRAWPGGAGEYKLGSNYGPTIMIQQAAMKAGCQQVLWLFGEDHKLTEVGTMNIFVLMVNQQGEKELVTPPLNGTILPGVTRLSVLQLAQQWGEFKVTEREITMKDIIKAVQENRLLEMFGAGTACVVSPVERILYEGVDYHIPTMSEGAPVTMRMLKELTDIQYGRTPSPWTEFIDTEDIQAMKGSGVQ